MLPLFPGDLTLCKHLPDQQPPSPTSVSLDPAVAPHTVQLPEKTAIIVLIILIQSCLLFPQAATALHPRSETRKPIMKVPVLIDRCKYSPQS